jgi:hypothetical protein
MYDHILIVGGTGMLREASILLASRCNLLTSVASTDQSLERLDTEISKIPVQHNLLRLDWNSAEFLSTIKQYVQQQRSCPSLVVAWFHRDTLGPKLAITLAESCKNDIYFLQVLSSASASPCTKITDKSIALPACIDFHRVILGFEIHNGKSRWLTNDEISMGVIASIDSNVETSIVGKISPWSERP